MALIKCPDCGRMFSEYAECCPECGCPTEDAKADSIYNVSKKETNNGDSSHTSDERNVSVPKPEYKGEDVPHISEGDSIKESEPKPTYDLVQKTSNVVNDDKEAKETEGVPISTEKETETEGENKADKSDRRTNGFIKYIAFGLIATVVVVLLVIWLVKPIEGCGSKAPQQTENPDEPNLTDSVINDGITKEAPETTLVTDEVIQNAIRDYLMGNEDAVRFTERARQSLSESSWPEVQCRVEGYLDSPSSFKDLTVNSVGAGLYKYECICPDHGDRYIDCCTISAYIAHDGVVEIEDVKWDD